MRTDIELLTILRDNIDKHLVTGLCKLSTDLYFHNIVTIQECSNIRAIIDINPTQYYKVSMYYFKPRNKPLRKAYLTRLIKKLKSQQS